MGVHFNVGDPFRVENNTRRYGMVFGIYYLVPNGISFPNGTITKHTHAIWNLHTIWDAFQTVPFGMPSKQSQLGCVVDTQTNPIWDVVLNHKTNPIWDVVLGCGVEPQTNPIWDLFGHGNLRMG